MANRRRTRPRTHWAKYALTPAFVEVNASACDGREQERLTRDPAQVTCVRCVGIVRWLGLETNTEQRKGTS